MKYQPAICVLLAMLLISACAEKEEFKPYVKGNIIGYAFCFDEFGNEPEDFSGIKVFTLPDRQYSTVTDENGRYEIKNVVNGTYDLSFEKEGFATMKLQGVKHLGGKPTIMHYSYKSGAPFIYQHITTPITDMNVVDDALTINLAISVADRPSRINLRIYFSTEEQFAIGSAMSVKNITANDRDDFYEDYGFLKYLDLPFETGDKVYYKACIFTSVDNAMAHSDYAFSAIDTYFDYENNETIYPNLSDESDEFSFIMP